MLQLVKNMYVQHISLSVLKYLKWHGIYIRTVQTSILQSAVVIFASQYLYLQSSF